MLLGLLKPIAQPHDTPPPRTTGSAADRPGSPSSWDGRNGAVRQQQPLVRKSIPNVPCCPSLIHEIIFPTALWPLLFGRESFGLGRREPLPHSRSCQRPPVPDPPEDENNAEEHDKPCRRILGLPTMNDLDH